MRHDSSDLLVILAYVAIAASAIHFLAGPFISLLALPLIFVLPGYVWTAALFPKRTLDVAEIVLFSLGGSLALDVLSGLGINFTSWGLSTLSWTVVLSGITVGGCIVARIRRRGSKIKSSRAKLGLGPRQGVVLGLSLIVMVGAIGMSRQAAIEQPSVPFTQLWVRPSSVSQADTYDIGVQSAEMGATTYRLVLRVNGNAAHEWAPITLDPGQAWTRSLQLPGASANRWSIELLLYRSDQPAVVYRHVTLQQGAGQ